MKGKGKGGTNKSSRLRRQEERHKKSNLSHVELKTNLLMIISNLETLVVRSSEKTDILYFVIAPKLDTIDGYSISVKPLKC